MKDIYTDALTYYAGDQITDEMRAAIERVEAYNHRVLVMQVADLLHEELMDARDDDAGTGVTGTLRELREELELTEAQVAEAMGISVKRYVALEQAPGKMRVSQLESLSRVLGFADPGDLADRVKFS
ncbi:MAG: helix-turn-helix domain-containing protein [Actinomycetota bacterium]